MNKVILGNNKEVLKTFADNSIDSIVTDPPYELGFMGKKWDSTGIAYDVELWQECMRVLKPGGHLLAFSGTRTYHRMAVAIEDAGFEVRDMIEWVYGSGFPKSLNVGKSINQIETKEWNNISKAIDNIDKSSIFALWKNNSNNVKIVETQSQKNAIEIGICMPKNDSVQENVMVSLPQKNTYVNAIIAELNLCEALQLQPETKELIATQNVEANTKQLQSIAKFAESLLQKQSHKSLNIFTAQCDVKEWLKENTEVSLKADEALKTLRGNKKYSNEEITSVLCAVLPIVLKLTILNQSKTFQNLDTIQKTECASAINVIITGYTAEHLITNTVNILKSKAVDKLQGNEREVVSETFRGSNAGKKSGIMGETVPRTDKLTRGTSPYKGWGTALKPAHEPICMARKPLSEKNVALNVLKWRTGGINIDESRVEGEMGADRALGKPRIDTDKYGKANSTLNPQSPLGRFPSNLIHDGSDEVKACFPESGKGGYPKLTKDFTGKSNITFRGAEEREERINLDSGNASRFFKSIIYQAKASKAERNRGCEGLEEKQPQHDFGTKLGIKRSERVHTLTNNNHPTVKPIALMAYLIKMVTPKGGVVLDPFAGSGSTLVAAKEEGFEYVGIDITPEYIEIINARLAAVIPQQKLF